MLRTRHATSVQKEPETKQASILRTSEARRALMEAISAKISAKENAIASAKKGGKTRPSKLAEEKEEQSKQAQDDTANAYGPGFLKLRKISAVQKIAKTVSSASSNLVSLPSDVLMLNIADNDYLDIFNSKDAKKRC